MKTKNSQICTIIGGLIGVYLKGKINEIDLYNSIIRLVYITENDEREKLKSVVEWVEKHDSIERMKEAYKDMNSVKQNAGEDYVQGIMRIANADK